MTLTLDPQLEQRIQREIDNGHYGDPAEVITHALNLLDEEQREREEDRAALDIRLDESMAQIERGEGISAGKARQILAGDRAARTR